MSVVRPASAQNLSWRRSRKEIAHRYSRLLRVGWLAASALAALEVEGGADGVRYEVEGSLLSRNVTTEGGPEAWLFSVQVDGCRWYITMVPQVEGDRNGIGGPHGSIKPDYRAAAFDGTRYYYLGSFESRRESRPGDSHHANAFVSADLDPVLGTWELKALWYLYASHCHLRTFTNGLYPPLDPVPPDAYRGGGYHRAADLRILKGSAGLPEWVSTGAKPEDFVRATNGTSRSSKILKGERLEVLESQDVGDFVIPASARLQGFLSLAAEQPWISIEIKAERANQTITRQSFVPEISTRTMFESAQFWRTHGAAQPIVITNHWPTEAEFTALIDPVSQPFRARAMVVLLILGVIVLGGPLWFAIKSRRKLETIKERSP